MYLIPACRSVCLRKNLNSSWSKLPQVCASILTGYLDWLSWLVILTGYLDWLSWLVILTGYLDWLSWLVILTGYLDWLSWLVILTGYLDWLSWLVILTGYLDWLSWLVIYLVRACRSACTGAHTVMIIVSVLHSRNNLSHPRHRCCLKKYSIKDGNNPEWLSCINLLLTDIMHVIHHYLEVYSFFSSLCSKASFMDSTSYMKLALDCLLHGSFGQKHSTAYTRPDAAVLCFCGDRTEVADCGLLSDCSVCRQRSDACLTVGERSTWYSWWRCGSAWHPWHKHHWLCQCVSAVKIMQCCTAQSDVAMTGFSTCVAHGSYRGHWYSQWRSLCFLRLYNNHENI